MSAAVPGVFGIEILLRGALHEPSRWRAAKSILLVNCMRLFSARLIIALIVGVILVSLCSSEYEVLWNKRNLKRDLQRRAEVLAKAWPAMSSATWSAALRRPCDERCNASPTGRT